MTKIDKKTKAELAALNASGGSAWSPLESAGLRGARKKAEASHASMLPIAPTSKLMPRGDKRAGSKSRKMAKAKKSKAKRKC